MMRKNPAPPEAPTSLYTATGEVKSPELRAAEITGANRVAKAARFVEALQKSGISAEAAKAIEAGRLGPTAIQGGAVPRWGNIADFLGENEPSDLTVKEIVKQLKKTPAKSASVAEMLRDEMLKNGLPSEQVVK